MGKVLVLSRRAELLGSLLNGLLRSRPDDVHDAVSFESCTDLLDAPAFISRLRASPPPRALILDGVDPISARADGDLSGETALVASALSHLVPRPALCVVVREGSGGLRSLATLPFDGVLVDPFELEATRTTLARALYGTRAMDASCTPEPAAPHHGSSAVEPKAPSSDAECHTMPAATLPAGAASVDVLAVFLRGLAHEINNPLAAALGLLQLASADHAEDRGLQGRLETARKELERIQTTVRELEHFVQLRKPQRRLLDWARLAESLTSDGPPEVQVEVDEHSPVPILGEEEALLRALRHLVQFAAGPDSDPVQVRVLRHPSNALLHVRSTVGVPLPDDPASLFLPYHEANRAGYLPSLQTAASHGIVRAHRGTLTVREEEGCVEFLVEIPRALAARAHRDSPETRSSEGAAASASRST